MRTTVTKERILNATMALVSQRGYLGATTREIAREAGVTELTLFRHFGSKERLFEQCIGKGTFLPALKELLPDLERMSYEQALRTIGRKFLLSVKERKQMVMIMQSEMSRSPAKMRRMYGQLMDEMLGTLGAYFCALQKRGLLRRFPSEVAARMFFGMLFSYFRTEEIMRGVDITKQGRMDRAVAGFVDIFVHGTLPIKNGNGKRRRT
jgi:AcrR family transcriptional regulator